MTTDTQNSPREPRLNPFVFPSDTDLRFVLLVVSVLGSSVFIYNWLHIVVFLEGHQEARRRCAASVGVGGANLPNKLPDAKVLDYMKCLDPFEQAQFLWTMSGVALLLVVAGAIYWAMPALKIRRDRLVPLTDERAPGVQACLQELCREAGLPRQPAFLVNPHNVSASGLAFGHRGRKYVSLNVGLVMKFYTDRSAFRAVVLHELAHLRNADVDKTYFSVATGIAFALVALVPLLGSLVYSVVRYGDPITVSWYVGPVLALLGLVYLTLAAILRARELYADVRASTWDGASGALERALSVQQRPDGGSWRTLRRFHPDPEQRRRAITATDGLFRMGFWDAFATGVTAMVAVPALYGALELIIPDSLVFWGRLLAVVPVAPLVVGVVGLGAWRGAFAALARGEVPRGTGVLGLGLGLGIIVGTILSPETAISWGQLTGSSTTAALALFLLAGLLLVGMGWFVRWMSAGAVAWLELVTTRRSLHLIVWLGLITASLLSPVWLGGWFLLFGSPDSAVWLANFAVTGPSDAQVTLNAQITPIASLIPLLGRSPLVLLVLVALWAFPLAASLWQRNMSAPPAAQWAFLDPSPPALTLRHHNRFRLSQALMVGMVGGLAFCALLLITRFWWNSVPESVRSTDQAKLALFGSQVAAAAVVQAIVAAIVTIRTRWLGVLHGLFGAFVAGCVMVVGMLGINAAFGSTIDASFAWLIFTVVMNSGALFALAVSGCSSAVVSWMRRKRPKYRGINAGSE